MSPFTLQERSPRGAEGIQSLAQPVGGGTTANALTSPLIRTWKYLVLGEEREELRNNEPFQFSRSNSAVYAKFSLLRANVVVVVVFPWMYTAGAMH